MSLLILLGTNTVMATSALLDEGNYLYGIQLTVSGSGAASKQFGYDTAETLFDAIDSANLSDEFSGYSDTASTVSSNINYRGVILSINFPNLNSNELVLNIPELGISKSFTGTSRDASSDLMADYFKENNNIINRLNKLLAQKSSTDPIAGNPTSLMSGMVDNAFNSAAGIKITSTRANKEVGVSTDGKQTASVFSTGVRFGKLRQGGKNVTSYTLPLSYEFKNNSGKSVSIGVPISYVEVNGAKSYKIGMDLSVKIPMDKKWTLSPGVGYGLIGSKDLLSAGQIASASLSSIYKLDKYTVGNDKWTLSIANMLGYYKTLPIKLKGVNIDPDITNTVSKNGLLADYNTEVLGTKSIVQVYITDTRFFGDKLYADRYNELGFYISPEDKTGLKKYLGLNASYLISNKDITGFNISLSYSF